MALKDMWLQLSRAAQATRFYPTTNPVRSQKVSQAYARLGRILRSTETITFNLTDGCVFHRGKLVYTEEDHNGLVSVLFTNGLLELSFGRGVTLVELTRFLEVALADYSHSSTSGEDLITALWRLNLTYIEYRSFDLLAVSIDHRNDDVEDDDERARLRSELSAITSCLATDRQSGQDLIHMIDGSLATPDARDLAAKSAQDDFASIQRLNRARFPESALDALAAELESQNTDEAVIVHLSKLLIDALRREAHPTNECPALNLFMRLMNNMVDGQALSSAALVLERLERLERRAKNERDAELAHHLLRQMGSQDFVARIIGAINLVKNTDVSKGVDLLTQLGSFATAALLEEIDNVSDNNARAALTQLLMELATPSQIARQLLCCRPEVATLLLTLSRTMAEQDRSALVWAGLNHPHPAPRAEAIRTLQRLPRTLRGEEALVAGLKDNSPLVQTAAVRAVRVWQCPQASNVLRFVIESGRLAENEPRLFATMMSAFAELAGTHAIPVLEKIALSSKLLGLKADDIQLSAVAALARIAGPRARAILQKGARSLSPKLRAACREALNNGAAPFPAAVKIPSDTGLKTGLKTSRKNIVERLPSAALLSPVCIPVERLPSHAIGPRAASVLLEPSRADLSVERLPSQAMGPRHASVVGIPVERLPSSAFDLNSEAFLHLTGDLADTIPC